MTQQGSQHLVEEDVENDQPPGERNTSRHQAQRRIDKQLCQVVGARDQLEPSPAGNPVGQSLHCTCMKRRSNYEGEKNYGYNMRFSIF